MKTEIYTKICILENDKNSPLRDNYKKGKLVRLQYEITSCFKCLDTRRCWKDRDNLPWSALDMRGHYDIIGCPNCNNIGWISCSHQNDVWENNYRIYHKDNCDWNDRFEQLYTKASANNEFISLVNSPPVANVVENEVPNKVVNEVVNEVAEEVANEVEEKALFELCKILKKEHLEESLDLEIEVGKIIDIVKNAVEAYFGNVFSIVDLAKELKVSFHISNSQSETNDKIIKIKDNNYLGIKTYVKVTDKKIKTGIFDKSKHAKEYRAEIFLLKPINNAAVEKSEMIMAKIGEEMTNDILEFF